MKTTIKQLKKLNDNFINEVLVDWETELKEETPDVDKLMAYTDDIGVRLDEIGIPKKEGDKLYISFCTIIDSHRNNTNTFPFI